MAKNDAEKYILGDQFEDETEEESDDGEDWNECDDGEDVEISEFDFICLFCDSKFKSCTLLFEHCVLSHHFDFHGIQKALSLDFYGSMKLINYVRLQVAENKCWTCGLICQSNQQLLDHLHETVNLDRTKHLWDDDKYLQPFMQDDALLHSFDEDEEDEDDYNTPYDKEEQMKDLRKFGEMCIEDEEVVSTCNGHLNMETCPEKLTPNGTNSGVKAGSSEQHSRVSTVNLIGKNIKKVNENYFGGYSSFGIHREMLGDKVRTDAYKLALTENPSLLNGAVVMDVGCGTGILSLFAAQAGASRVISVDGSEKMATVATQIAKENGLLKSNTHSESTGVVEVVNSMVEEIEKSIHIQPQSLDIIVSEWMGYCLLYESMLSSVLFARDHWLKPGGAILPDTATIFVAGFGKGGTSLPFWENVYGFDMSSVGKELVEDAAKIPIIDIVDPHDIVTCSTILQTFDLATMKPDEVDFTASVDLEPKIDVQPTDSVKSESKTKWCYGVVLWFDTGFTSRFCKDKATVLSTSPYTPKTHWSQTILTFHEPIAMALGKPCPEKAPAVGTDACPAEKIHLRISIARAPQHRDIDISVETTGIGSDGRKQSWPVQIFNLT